MNSAQTRESPDKKTLVSEMVGSSPTMTRASYTVTCVPTSTTRPVGIWKKLVASVALLVSEM